MPVDTAGLHRRFVLLTALRWLPVGFTAPVLVLLQLSRGLTLAQVGITMAFYGFATAALELPTGGLADAFGRRRVLTASSALGIVVFVAMLVADGLGPWIATMVLAGAARALDSGPLEAWFVDEVRGRDPGADIRHGLSHAQAVEGAGLALAAVAGGLLPVAFGGSLNAAVAAALGAAVLHLLGVLTMVSEHRALDACPPASALRQMPEAVRSGLAAGLRTRPVMWLLCGSAVWGLALAAIELLWQPRFVDLLGPRSDTGPLGLVMAGAFVAAAGGSAMAPRVGGLTGWGAGRSAAACTLAQGAVLLALAAAGSVVVAAPAFVLVYLTSGARGPFHHELLHEHCDAAQRTTMLSAASLSLMAGGLIGSLIVPRLEVAVGVPWTWGLVAGVVAVSSALYLWIPDRPDRGCGVGLVGGEVSSGAPAA